MSKIKILAAVALAASLSSLVAAPASAREWRDGRGWDRGVGPGAVAAGIAGAAIGTAGAIASAPFRDSYAYYGDDVPGYDYAPGYDYGYAPGYRGGSTWNSKAGAGGYNTGATNRYYNTW